MRCGIIENPGRIMIFTCNHLDRLDPAFSRPGRIDYTLEFKKCNHAILAQILTSFFQQPIANDDVSSVNEYSVTPAQVMAECKMHKSVDSVLQALRLLK